MSKTHWKKLTNPNYLGAYSLEDGKDLILTIDNVKEETVVGEGGSKEDKPVMHFKERDTKPMIMNATNMKMIAKLYSSPFIEDWNGCKIQLYSTPVSAFGTTTDALRIRDIIPKSESINLTCTDCDCEIKESHGKSAESISKSTYSKYGKALCADCATKLAEKQKKDEPEDPLAEDVN